MPERVVKRMALIERTGIFHAFGQGGSEAGRYKGLEWLLYIL